MFDKRVFGVGDDELRGVTKEREKNEMTNVTLDTSQEVNTTAAARCFQAKHAVCNAGYKQIVPFSTR
jgi:hypothetical protein